MDVVAYLPADPQAAEPVQVSERAFHDPALGAQARAVLGAPASDDRLHAEVRGAGGTCRGRNCGP